MARETKVRNAFARNCWRAIPILMLRTRANLYRTAAISNRRIPREKNHQSAKPGLGTRMASAAMIAHVIDDHVPLDRLTGSTGFDIWTSLDTRDQNLARAIAVTALRNRGVIEAILGFLLDRPLPKRARHLAHSLHAAAAQILFMDIPARAAVDLCVTALSRDTGSKRFTGLANALLRRITAEKDALLAKPVPPQAYFPQWLAKALRSDYGRDAVARIAGAVSQEPALDLTLNPTIGMDLRSRIVDVLEAVVLPTGSLRVRTAAPVTDLPFYDEGHWWVQDAASALPARMLGNVDGLEIADLCAAPGGKTAQLAAGGARVTAVDISAQRMKRLEENLLRTRLEADLVTADILEWEPGRLFDAVLLDAPCSSTGTMRRHPDVIWTKQPEDVEALVALQRKLIGKAAALVKPGGRMVYANCSILKSEGENLAAAILQGSKGEGKTQESGAKLVRDALRPDEVPGTSGMINSAGDLRTLPHYLPDEDPKLAGMDAFFACRFSSQQTIADPVVDRSADAVD